VKSALERKSQKERLERLVQDLENLMPQAVQTYQRRPSGYHAQSLTTLSAEIRQLMKDITKLEKPEQQALKLIRKVLQPLLRNILKDFTKELVRARTTCIAVADSPETDRAIREAFSQLGLDLGVVVNNHYKDANEEIGTVLECDLDELKRLASGVGNPAAETESDDHKDNVVKFRKTAAR